MEHITINSDRSVTVPVELRKIGVQYDHNVNTIEFVGPRYSGNVDLSTMTIYINYILSDKTPGKYKAENVIIDDQDNSLIRFNWTITRNVTKASGILSCLVCAKKTDEEGNEINHWNTDIFRLLSVSEGMENDPVIQEQYPDVITSLIQNVEEHDTKLLEFSGLNNRVTDLENIIDELKDNLNDHEERIAYLEENGTGGSGQQTITKTESINLTEGQSKTLKDTAKTQNVVPSWTLPTASGGDNGSSVTLKQLMVSDETFPVSFSGNVYGLIGSMVFGSPAYAALNAKGEDVGGNSKMFVSLYLDDVQEGTTIATTLGLVDSNGDAASSYSNGWYYGVLDCLNSSTPTNTKPTFKPSAGLKIKYAYGISVGILLNEGTIKSQEATYGSITKQFSQSKYKELPITPNPSSVGISMVTVGEPSEPTQEKASATIDGVIYNSDTTSIPVKSSSVVTVQKGGLAFEYQYTETSDGGATGGRGGTYPDWSEWTWVCVGDSLTDETINASKKYYRYIEEKTGIKTVICGVGGTGYARDNLKTYANATGMYYQRCVGIADKVRAVGGSLDKVVVSVFGSINDWCVTNPNDERFIGGTTYPTREQACGKGTDTWTDGGDNTLCAHMRHCYEVIWSEIPLAHLFVVNHLFYAGIAGQDIYISDILKDVCDTMLIKHFDLYHNGSYPIKTNQAFANKYTTDAPTDVIISSGSFGHPSNAYHEEFLAPYFLKCLREVLPL